MSLPVAKELALGIGEQISNIEVQIGTVAGYVMRAAIQHNPDPADAAYKQAHMLDDMMTALVMDLRRFQKALRS